MRGIRKGAGDVKYVMVSVHNRSSTFYGFMDNVQIVVHSPFHVILVKDAVLSLIGASSTL